MNITDIRIRIIKKTEDRLKAVASIVIDECFAVHDIKILKEEDGYSVKMPSRKTPDGKYRDIVHPINSETREKLVGLIMEEFNKALAAEGEE